MNYYGNPDAAGFHDKMEDLRMGDFFKSEDTTKLPPWMLRLTDGEDYGLHLLYDVRDRNPAYSWFTVRVIGNANVDILETIIEWTFVGLKSWNEYPSRPCKVVLSEIVRKYESLEWVPWFDPDDDDDIPHRKMIENPLIVWSVRPGFLKLPSDDPSAAVQLVRSRFGQEASDNVREQINRWKAFQKLFRDSGWGSESSFNGDDFDRKRLELLNAAKEFETQRLSYGSESFAQLGGIDPAQQEVLAQGSEYGRRVFWTGRADEDAI